MTKRLRMWNCRKLCAALAVVCLQPFFMTANSIMAQNKTVFTINVTRPADMAKETVTKCEVNSAFIALKFGLGTDSRVNSALSSGLIEFYGIQSNGNFYSTYTNGAYGHWFAKSGNVVANNHRNAVVGLQFSLSGYSVTHIPTKVALGDKFTCRQALVYDEKDTIEYVVNLTIGDKESVTTDQPDEAETFVHRKDYGEGWIVKPLVGRNDEMHSRHYIQVWAGDKITIGAHEKNEGETVTTLIKSPQGKTVKSYVQKGDYVVDAAAEEHAGTYEVTCRVKGVNGKVTIKRYNYFVDVQTAEPGTHYDWAVHTPKFGYDFRSEYPNLPTPTKTHNVKKKNGQPANKVEGEWWSAFWGDNLNSEVAENTKNAFTNMMKKYDEDFAYIRDHMGWPPDLSPRNGYRSFVYVFGSGLENDNSPNTEKGGYQSSIWVDGRNWPCVYASYYPVSRFRDDADQKWNDGDYQREAMIHEGIHALFADMEGVKKSAWFHEAGNTWLQSAMNTERSGTYGTPGFLDACPFIAPFMPIECYSGWLQDGSFGGPAAEGVNMYDNNGRQVCTWRNLLGGNQYGNSFPIVLGEICGKSSIPWIWRYCKDYVLKGIGDSIGEEQMRSLILQYRARQATFDIGGWATGYRQITDNNFGSTVRAEWRNGVCSTPGGTTVGANAGSDQMACWIDCEPYVLTPYVDMYRNTEDGWLAPDTLTNPGWSGANIIPIHVKGDYCEVEFLPEDLQMRAQLCYRTKAGKVYYSQPVHCGTLSLDISDTPANGVIFCVVANTDYIYTGNAQRKKHYDYRLKLGVNAVKTASKDCRWYFYERTIKDQSYEDFITDVEEVKIGESSKSDFKGIRLMSGAINSGSTLKLDMNGNNPEKVTVRVVGLSGLIVEAGKLNNDATFTMPAGLYPGMYFITFSYEGKKDVYKVFIKR